MVRAPFYSSMHSSHSDLSAGSHRSDFSLLDMITATPSSSSSSSTLLPFSLQASATMGWSENSYLGPETFVLLRSSSRPDPQLNSAHSLRGGRWDGEAKCQRRGMGGKKKMQKKVGLFHVLRLSTFQMSWTCVTLWQKKKVQICQNFPNGFHILNCFI